MFGWSEEALPYAEKFIRSRRTGTRLTGSDVRRWCLDNGCPFPTSQRAWGSVMAGLARRGLIRKIGYTLITYEGDKYASATSSPTPSGLWEVR